MTQQIAEMILCEIRTFSLKKQPLLIAIDGRCAAGKTTLAADLQRICGCNVIHMDHFFLRPEQRTARRMLESGGNVDYERFLTEVMIPLRQGKAFFYRVYDCHKQKMTEVIEVKPNSINVIAGSYSCHPMLAANYDLKIFLSVDEKEQMRRIEQRNGKASAIQFKDKWIPLEERYFSAFHIRESCSLYFQT